AINDPHVTKIEFASSVTNITLMHGAPDVATALDIEGPGAGALTVSGNHASGVFTIDSGVTATLAGVTIANGESAQGGGILLAPREMAPAIRVGGGRPRSMAGPNLSELSDFYHPRERSDRTVRRPHTASPRGSPCR